MIRQPVGVAASSLPSTSRHDPFLVLPYALACGNTFIVKPSERCPLTMQKVFRLFEQRAFHRAWSTWSTAAPRRSTPSRPSGDRGVTFVGSTAVARHVYARASASGKRVQAQGGAKNPLIVLPDADVELTTSIVTDSAFGNAGQRCLAASLAITVGEADRIFTPALAEAATSRVVGYGLDDGVQMGPVITPQSKERIEGLIQHGLDEGAQPSSMAAACRRPGYEAGNFVRPTILADVPPGSTLATTEIFGPVLGLMHVETVDDAIALVNSGDTATWPACSPAAARRRANSATRPRPATSASTSASPRRWPSSPSAAGRIASSARCTARESTRSSSSRRPRSWSNAGWGSGRGSSE